MEETTNPYESGRLVAEQEVRVPAVLSYLWLLFPPTLCVSTVAGGHLLPIVTGSGPTIFAIQLFLISIGAVVPAMTIGTVLALQLGNGAKWRVAVFLIIEIAAIFGTWIQTMTVFPHWS